MEFFTNPSYAPFAYASYLLAGLLFFEIVLLISGLGSSSFIDEFLPEFSEPSSGSFSISSVLYYFGFGKVPAVMLITMFSGFFSAIGLLIQTIAVSIVGAELPAWFAVVIAIPLALLCTRPTSAALGKVLNSEKGLAVSQKTLIGRIAIITDGTATHTDSASAKVYDASGSAHDIYVKSAEAEHVFARDEKVTIVSVIDGFYLVSHSE